MSKPKLTVIEGGISHITKSNDKLLVSACITDTRLMGVLAIYAHWRTDSDDAAPDLHQFFYIDCEENGLENYLGITGDDPLEIESAEQALFGGLGANKIDLTYPQLHSVLKFYCAFNSMHGLALPEGYSEYSFLVEGEDTLDPAEQSKLMRLICGEITSDYQAINYFLMRCFGNDHRGAAYLASGDFDIDIYMHYKEATFCRNVIDDDGTSEDGARAYLCESLIEQHGKYEVIVSRVCVKDRMIVGLSHCSGFAVSVAEAAMMLVKPEYVTVYEVLLSDEDMECNLGELNLDPNTTMSTQENGTLFMTFKKSNDHVGSRVFRLSDDVRGIYYLTDYGQLIAAAYSLQGIRRLENHLELCLLEPYLIPTSKYEFKEPILLEFMQSDFEDFDDFLNFLQDE